MHHPLWRHVLCGVSLRGKVALEVRHPCGHGPGASSVGPTTTKPLRDGFLLAGPRAEPTMS